MFLHYAQDTYVLHDYSFRLLTPLSNTDQYKDRAPIVSHLIGWFLRGWWVLNGVVLLFLLVGCCAVFGIHLWPAVWSSHQLRDSVPNNSRGHDNASL